MLNFTRRLLALRKVHPALQIGQSVPVTAPEGVLAFERRLGDQRVLCLFEMADRDTDVHMPGTGTVLFAAPSAVTVDAVTSLAANGAAMVLLD
jgi:alpha-glucosidase